MGVIDLNARVTELEKYGGAQIDQIEAADTALENELGVTVTDVTEDCGEILIEGVSLTSATLVTYGKLALFQATIESNTTSMASIFGLYPIPDELQPPGTRICIENDPGTVWLQKTGSHTFVAANIKGKSAAEAPAVTRYLSVLWIIEPPSE